MSCELPILALCIPKGETVALPLRIETSTLTYKPITAVTQSGPVSITAIAHGLSDGWRAAAMNVGGMTELNAEENPPEDAAYHPVTVVDVDTVQFNDVNSAGFRAYTSGGQLVFPTPLNLAAYSEGRMEVKDRVGGTLLVTFTTDDGSLELDAANQTLWLHMSDTDSAALTAQRGVFDIELVTPLGVVKKLCSPESEITFDDEVTT